MCCLYAPSLLHSPLLTFSLIHPSNVVPPASPAAADARKPQVAHGLILRCFVKRWLGFSVDFTLQMMLAPGAIAVLRYVSFQTRLRQYVDVKLPT